jgi:hypothetical protein
LIWLRLQGFAGGDLLALGFGESCGNRVQQPGGAVNHFQLHRREQIGDGRAEKLLMDGSEFFAPERGVAFDDCHDDAVRAVERVAFFAADEAGGQERQRAFGEREMQHPFAPIWEQRHECFVRRPLTGLDFRLVLAAQTFAFFGLPAGFGPGGYFLRDAQAGHARLLKQFQGGFRLSVAHTAQLVRQRAAFDA